MKKSILFFFLAFLSVRSFSQSSEIRPDQGISVPQFETTFIDAMLNQPKGTVVFDKDLNVMKYWNGTEWQTMSGGSSGSGNWVISGNDQYAGNTGNIGIGTAPTLSKLEVQSANTTTAVFGSNSTGISLQQNWPTIGFNQYRDASNVQRYIGNGFAFGNFIDPGTGSMFWHSIATGTANAVTPAETQAMSLSSFGQLKVNSLSAINPANQLNVGGGKLTAVSTGGSFSVGHGESSGGNFPIFTNYYLQMDGSRIQASSGLLFNVGTTRLLLNPFGGNVGINSGSTSFNSNLYVAKSASSNDGAAVFKGTTHFAHFHYGTNEDTYIRGGKNGSNVIINDGGLGNVGIGVYPSAYKLEVNGTARTKEVIVETGWADYVFENDYKLKSIDELETFVKENKHLPNIPKASEIEKNGMKVGETNKAMMEKIEELALYIIQLKKEIDILKSKY